jgi:hypothetical protein
MRTAEEVLRSIIADVEAMSCTKPYACEGDSSEAWFGSFNGGQIDPFDPGSTCIEWPNLRLLIDEAKNLLNRRAS